jgi:cystathionine beta-lyase
MHDFDKEPSGLRNPVSYKWGLLPDDIIPMFVAVMDFDAPDTIFATLKKRLEYKVFGYERGIEQFFDTVTAWFKRIYGLEVRRDWLLPIAGIVPALAALSRLTAHRGILTNSPNYVGLLKAPERAGKEVIKSPLLVNRLSDGTLAYSVDYEDLEKRSRDTGLFYLTNPLNPVGKVFERSELEDLSKFARNNNQIVLSDEIHCEIIFGKKHIPYFDVDHDNSISLYAAGKICNIAGIPHAFAVIPNAELRERVKDIASTMGHPGVLEYLAAQAAFSEETDGWKRELNKYLEGNRDYLEAELRQRFPKASLPHTDATYLQWIDFSAYIDGDAKKFIRENAKVELTDGVSFAGTESNVRLNFATQRSRLTEALDRIESALNK